MTNAPNIESPESSSPIVTRAVAAGLQNQFIDNFEIAGWQKATLEALTRLPQGVAMKVISPFQTLSALPQSAITGLNVNTLAEAWVTDYGSLTSKRYPAITLGAALGGTTAHLSLALNTPFLPQAFVVTFKGGAYLGDVQEYFELGHQLALEIARRNPNVLTIQHYDPVHDNWLTRYVNHLRLKLLSLPTWRFVRINACSKKMGVNRRARWWNVLHSSMQRL
jgi:hypothetical protein